ncbi:MAG: hypothetical protein WC358_03355 [Ignavibacteria bacterium]|jgi:hypothetical protein
MRLTIGENTYILKMRTEAMEHEMEKHPDEVASKSLNTLSMRELSAALRRMRRNKIRATHRKCRTTASLFISGNFETPIATVSVSNCLDDQFNAPRGRREAMEKLKLALLDLPDWTAEMNRALTIAFYNRYPNSRPVHSK